MYQDLQNIQNAVNNLDSLITQKDNAITQLETAVAVRDQAIFGYQTKIFELNAKLEAAKKSPSGITRILSNQNKVPWIQAGAKGNTDPKPTDPVGTFVMTPGDEANWYVAGADKYSNSYWYRKYPGESGERFIYPFEIRFMTQADIDACNEVEIEWQMNKDDLVYNMAWQNDPKGKGFWKTFIYNGGKPLLDASGKRLNSWPPTAIPATKFTPGIWVSIIAEFFCDTVKHTVTHVSLTIDGKTYPVGITRDAFPQVQGDYVSTGFQLDTLGISPPPPFNVKTRNMHPMY